MAGIDSTSFEALLLTGTGHDFPIRCKGTEFYVHKLILSCGSHFFEGLLRSTCKVSRREGPRCLWDVDH